MKTSFEIGRIARDTKADFVSGQLDGVIGLCNGTQGYPEADDFTSTPC